MNWSRVKTLLVALMLAVNLVLGGIWLYRESQVRASEVKAEEDLCAVLLRNGLTAKPGQFPGTTALTYDVERSSSTQHGAAPETVKGLPLWNGMDIQGDWLWEEALPVRGQVCYSEGYCLMQLTETWDSKGVLETCELGFRAESVSSGVIWLKPCWRFVISGREYFFPAA